VKIFLIGKDMDRRNSKIGGFTLLVSVVVTGAILLISTGMVTLAVKYAFISSSGRESQIAFYAADTGVECVLFWDVKSPNGQTAFSQSEQTAIHCNRDSLNPLNQWQVGGSRTSVINKLTFLPDPFCAIVTVTKNADGTTLVESKGYNTCDPSNPRRVERAVRATY